MDLDPRQLGLDAVELVVSEVDVGRATVPALMSSGVLDGSLQGHIKRAKTNGATTEEMAKVLTHAAFYAVWPKAWAAFRMAKEAYEER